MNTQAYLEGYKAYEDYQHLSDNPYPTESVEHFDWEIGFGQAEGCDA